MIIWYVAVGIIGGFWAALEILSRHKDEPFKALYSSQYCYLFVLLNGLISVLGLVLIKSKWPEISNYSALAIAAFGGPAFLRARVFDIRTGDRTVQIGPGFLVDEFLKIIQRQIKRKRAVVRLGFVTTAVDGLDYTWVREEVVSIATESLNLEKDEIEDLKRQVDIIDREERDPNGKLRSLGFLLLDFGGEVFLNKVTDTLRLTQSNRKTPEV